MKEIYQPGEYSFVISRYLKPIANVKPGETVSIHTKDAFENMLMDEKVLPSSLKNKYLNPLTGPVLIEGAEQGDTLAVKIISIEPDRDFAVSANEKNFGGLVATEATRFLNGSLPEKVWIYKKENGYWKHNDKMCYPYRPFIGTIATSHDLESISSLTPFNQGGNMDVSDVRPGNTLYLPVTVDGAYFYVGDCHANQGDGELMGVALEIPATVTLQFELIKGKKIKWPRLENEKSIMTIGSARPMEDAARIAYCELVEWMVSEYGWDQLDAYQALTQIGKLYVGNMVDTYYSLVAGIDKKYL